MVFARGHLDRDYDLYRYLSGNQAGEVHGIPAYLGIEAQYALPVSQCGTRASQNQVVRRIIQRLSACIHAMQSRQRWHDISTSIHLFQDLPNYEPDILGCAGDKQCVQSFLTLCEGELREFHVQISI